MGRRFGRRQSHLSPSFAFSASRRSPAELAEWRDSREAERPPKGEFPLKSSGMQKTHVADKLE